MTASWVGIGTNTAPGRNGQCTGPESYICLAGNQCSWSRVIKGKVIDCKVGEETVEGKKGQTCKAL